MVVYYERLLRKDDYASSYLCATRKKPTIANKICQESKNEFENYFRNTTQILGNYFWNKHANKKSYTWT